jgi:hypothetical protein
MHTVSPKSNIMLPPFSNNTIYNRFSDIVELNTYWILSSLSVAP